MNFLIRHPGQTILYFLAAIGSLTYYGDLGMAKVAGYWSLGMAKATGLLLLFIGTYIGGTIVWQTKTRLNLALSLSLILFILGSLLLMAEGRALLGIHDAVDSRHTTIATLGIVGLYLGMISLETKYVSVKRLLVGFLLTFIILGIGLSYAGAIHEGPEWRDNKNLDAYYLSTFRVQSDQTLRSLFVFNPQIAREGAEVLEKHRLNVFSRPSLEPEELTPVEGSTQSNYWVNRAYMENCPAGQQDSCIINAEWQATLTIQGWAVDQQAQNTAGGVFINIDGQIDIPALYGRDRPDVATLLMDNRYRFSGFFASFSTALVGEGQHVLSLKIVTADKKGYYEADQKIILEIRYPEAPPPPPVAPTLVSPADDATVSGDTVTFQWEPVDGATSYALIVNTVNNPFSMQTVKLFRAGAYSLGDVNTYLDKGYFKDGTTYYWWVWAQDAAGQSSWPEVSAKGRSFINGANK